MGSHAGTLLNDSLLQPQLACDLELQLCEVTEEFETWLNRFAPFGNANPEPVFVSRNATLQSAPRIIKDRHVCLMLCRPDFPALSAMGWSRSFDWTTRCSELSLCEGSSIDLAYRIRRNSNAQFGGIELELCDIRSASPSA
jgi:single-stranded-DNA-specific exonuclease